MPPVISGAPFRSFQGADFGAHMVLRVPSNVMHCECLFGKFSTVIRCANEITITEDSTAQAIRALHAQGLRVIMATGDNE